MQRPSDSPYHLLALMSGIGIGIGVARALAKCMEDKGTARQWPSDSTSNQTKGLLGSGPQIPVDKEEGTKDMLCSGPQIHLTTFWH